MTTKRTPSITVMAASVLLMAAVACSSTPEAATTPAAADQVRVVVAATDLTVGPNRYTFGILDDDLAPIRVSEARATFLYLDTDPPQARAQVTAEFFTWPAGRAGVYVTHVSFDEAGRWGVVVEVAGEDGTPVIGQAGFVVNPESSSPAIGSPAPPSVSKTARDFPDLTEITSSPVPDPDLYQVTIAEAVSSGRPTVVTFATPAFCQTLTCGPQMEVVTSLKDRYKGQANFVHVEVYDNPKEMAGSFANRRLSPILEEWGLLTEPFTFVMDANGLVSSKFEGFATEREIEAAIEATLSP